jgi:hypothetical protein
MAAEAQARQDAAMTSCLPLERDESHRTVRQLRSERDAIRNECDQASQERDAAQQGAGSLQGELETERN